MGKGRPRKPDELHVLQGTWTATRHGDPDARVQADGSPVPPKDLKGPALRYWKRIVPQLVACGVAKDRDAEALAALCRWWVRYDEHMAAGETRDAAVAFHNWRSLAAAFGLTPMDRAKLRGPEKPKGNDLDKLREAMG